MILIPHSKSGLRTHKGQPIYAWIISNVKNSILLQSLSTVDVDCWWMLKRNKFNFLFHKMSSEHYYIELTFVNNPHWQTLDFEKFSISAVVAQFTFCPFECTSYSGANENLLFSVEHKMFECIYRNLLHVSWWERTFFVFFLIKSRWSSPGNMHFHHRMLVK
jgi:hypothetical protein